MGKNRLNRKMDRLLGMETQGRLKTSYGSRLLRKLTGNRLAILGAVIFLVIVFLCVFAPLFTPYAAKTVDLRSRLSPPSAKHLLGTDKIGRDVWARMLYGGRVSIFIGLGSALGAALIGVFLGTYVGYKGGLADAAVLKLSEIFMSFPSIILVLVLVSITGQSLWNLVLIFILTGWASMYRMARSQVLSLREQEYVQALRAFGIHDFVVCFKHILPNAVGPIFVNITLSTAMFILQETALSFLGLGVPIETSTWGNILSNAQDLTVLRENWWLWLPTGLFLTLFVLSINFIGDGLRDATDPTQMG